MNDVSVKPSDEYTFAPGGDVLLIACGALAREIVDLIEANRWHAFDVQCLPAKWHNTPQFIVPAVRDKIRSNRARYKSIFVLYGDCGTGGRLDAMLAEEGVERIGGPHCYAFFTGNAEFARRAEHEFDAFYLTDYLARHFDKLIWAGLGLDRHPELLADYFGNYRKLVYLSQVEDAHLLANAEKAAVSLGLQFEHRHTGYGELASTLAARDH
jgi:Protein of unknown function (DUF1638)